MHIIIMGCGRVGSTLAADIEAQGHSIAIIDKDPESFRRLPSNFAGSIVTGMGFDRDVLIEAGIQRADAFAAVSSGDNSNIISARVARETFGVNSVIARIYDSRRAEVYARLGIPTIATVRWTVHQMIRALLPSDDEREVWRDATSTVAIIEIAVHPEWIGSPLVALERATGARVACLTRFGLGILPMTSTVIQDGDQIFMLVTDDMANDVNRIATNSPAGGAQ